MNLDTVRQFFLSGGIFFGAPDTGSNQVVKVHEGKGREEASVESKNAFDRLFYVLFRPPPYSKFFTYTGKMKGIIQEIRPGPVSPVAPWRTAFGSWKSGGEKW